MVSLNFIKETGNSFFEDKIRKTDFVLVVSRVSAHENEKIITKYLKNAQAAGLEMEQVYGITEPVVFIKIHLPQETYDYLDTAWPLWNITRNVKHKVMKRRWYRNHLSYMDPRMGVDYLGKVYFIAKLLNRTKYGKRVMDKGINKLLSKKIFLHAFPLHDGGVESFDLPDQKMNDLTLLAKYWDNVPALFKEPPLDMIKKYYGLEIAFYFAWLGFYKRMLIFPLILSICTLLAIFVEYVFMFEEDFKNLCRAEKIRMCRYCIQSWKLCEFDDLYEQCVSMKISLVVDNIVPFTYGSVMSAWAGVTVGLWKQREKYLRTRWNVGRDEIQLEERFEFRDEVIFRRKSKLTGFTEAFKPMSYSLFLFIGCFLLTAVVCLSPIPKIVGGIDSLNQILLWFTCISVLSNSMASVITSHFLALLNYRISRGTFVGFFENALSQFAVEDMMGDAFRNETCWYRDLRFGPYAGDRKYEHDPKYFQQMYTNCMYVGIQQFSVITLYYIFNKAVELYQEMTTEKYDEKYDILDQTKN
ncbi:anoctamin-6-like [Aethina tumida]|uniref:anoctamin-6-like n=1 Tax=Aethina tumida TaxID=116153 RepID=UPI0021488D0D|nr:anoctamin-6-like [Aethina tumida]